MNFIKHMDIRLRQFKTIPFMILMPVLCYITTIPFIVTGLCYEKYFGHLKGRPANQLGNLLYVLLLGPFVESLIFQSFLTFILNKFKMLRNKDYLIAFISAILFGISHSYNLIYIASMIAVGFLLSYSYFIYREKAKYPVLITTSIHGLYNSIVLLIHYFVMHFFF